MENEQRVDAASGPWGAWCAHREWVTLVGICVLIFLIRLPHAMRPTIDWDESLYWYMGWDWLQGGLPYQTTFDHKGPLLYLLPVPVLWVFGPSVIALRIATTLCLIGTMVLLYRLAGRWLNGVGRLVVPLVYGLLYSTSVFGGMASNAELFMLLPAVGAVELLLEALARPAGRARVGLLVAAGACCALGCLVKQIAFFSAAIVPVLLVVAWLRGEWRVTWKQQAWELVAVVAGGVAACVPFVVYYGARGGLADLQFAFLTYNLHYVESVPAGEALRRLGGFLAYHVRRDPPTVAMVLGVVWLGVCWRGLRTQERWLIGGLGVWYALSMVGVFSPRNMYPHYYLQLAPPMALVVGLAVQTLLERVPRGGQVGWWGMGVGLLVGVGVLLTPSRVGGTVAKFRDADQRPENLAAMYIQERTEPGEPVFVLGASGVIYLLAERGAPTKYFLWLFHHGRWEAGLQIREETLAAFEVNPPRYMVIKANPMRVEYLEEFVKERYALVQRYGEHYIVKLKETEKVEESSGKP